MKIRLIHFVILFMAAFVLASCLSTDEEEYTFYDDAAITAFSLGTINQYLYAKDSNGKDSLYTDTYDGSDYDFYIDNVAGKIYNPDSLPFGTTDINVMKNVYHIEDPSESYPFGTDAAHILATISTKNNGMVVIKPTDSDNLEDYTYYTSTDSIDFSTPRTFRVYSQSGLNYRDYTVTVNVHKEIGDTLIWHSAPGASDFTGLSSMKSVVCGDYVLLLGNNGGATDVYTINRLTGTSWSKYSGSFGADAYANVAVMGGQAYLLDDGSLYSSADGQNWTAVAMSATGDKPDMLVGASEKELYGMLDSKFMVSRDNGISWELDEVDDDAAPVPTTDMSCTRLPLSTNEGMERVMLVGKKNTNEDDANNEEVDAVVWTKIVDNSTLNPGKYDWTYVDAAGDNNYALPALDGLTVLGYDGNNVAFGMESGAPSEFLVSRDGGITWKADDSYYLPEGFSGRTAFTAAVDADNHIWLIDGSTGNVWKGRINRLGWAVADKVFTE